VTPSFARVRPGAVCETARGHRISLHTQDRIRNAPLDERDSLRCVPYYETYVNNKRTFGDDYNNLLAPSSHHGHAGDIERSPWLR
jgi:hypothetical protein